MTDMVVVMEESLIEIEPVVRALGVKQVKTVGAYEVAEIEATLKHYMQLDEPSVLITLGVAELFGVQPSMGVLGLCIGYAAPVG